MSRRRFEPAKTPAERIVLGAILVGFLLGLVTGFGNGLAVGLLVTGVVLGLALLEDFQINADARQRIADSEKAKRS